MRTHWPAPVSGVTLVAALAAACTSAQGGAPATDVASFCARLSDVFAQRTQRCNGGSAHAVRVGIGVLAPCDDLQASVAAGRVAVHPESEEACVDAIAADGCDLIDATPCRAAIEGRVEVGAGCYPILFAVECAGTAWCDTSGENACPSGVCRAFAQPGEPCAGSTRCQGTDGWLSGPFTSQCDFRTQTCVVLAGPGEPCDPVASSKYCRSDLRCTGGVCQHLPTSGPCADPSACSPPASCVGWSPSTPGTCTAKKNLGDACTPGAGECGVSTYCAPSGVCTEYSPIGGACGGTGPDAAECENGFCQSGTCMAFVAPGASCTASAEACGPRASCDPATRTCISNCTPTSHCGAVGEACCPNAECASDGVCSAGKCARCGGRGEPCCRDVCPGSVSCTSNPTTCADGGCCTGAHVCAAAGEGCGDGAGACSAGSCTTCGGAKQPCCFSPGTEIGWCSAPATTCICEGKPPSPSRCSCFGAKKE